MKRTIFAILLGFVALTRGCSIHCDDWEEDNLVCASDGKTYQNKWAQVVTK